MTQPVNLLKLHDALSEDAGTSLDQRWKDMQRTSQCVSTEIDALTRSEASAYVQLRRVFEREAGTIVPSLATR